MYYQQIYSAAAKLVDKVRLCASVPETGRLLSICMCVSVQAGRVREGCGAQLRQQRGSRARLRCTPLLLD